MKALPHPSAALGLLGPLAVLAQDTPAAPADDTGRTITLVIGALLGLALLLAVLTAWYWRRTDPRKRARATADPIAVTAAERRGPSRPPARATPPRTAAGVGGGGTSGEGTAADRGISNDEWLRLTGARQSPPRDRT